MNDKKSIFTEAKLLASSIASSLDILYEHNVMSVSTVKQYNKSDDVLLVIGVAANKLSEMMEILDEER